MFALFALLMNKWSKEKIIRIELQFQAPAKHLFSWTKVASVQTTRCDPTWLIWFKQGYDRICYWLPHCMYITHRYIAWDTYLDQSTTKDTCTYSIWFFKIDTHHTSSYIGSSLSPVILIRNLSASVWPCHDGMEQPLLGGPQVVTPGDHSDVLFRRRAGWWMLQQHGLKKMVDTQHPWEKTSGKSDPTRDDRGENIRMKHAVKERVKHWVKRITVLG